MIFERVSEKLTKFWSFYVLMCLSDTKYRLSVQQIKLIVKIASKMYSFYDFFKNHLYHYLFRGEYLIGVHTTEKGNNAIII